MKKFFVTFFDWPPIWLLFAMSQVWLLSRVFPSLSYPTKILGVVGWTLIVAGVVLMILSAYLFWRHRTSVIPKRTPNSLITTGPYRFSRNPIYLADLMILIGMALIFGAITALIPIVAFVSVINARFIKHEEGYMQAEFGDVFSTYCTQVRRWI
ncbi:MAG: isoprenylcysteine carboxylmethyltransferase family protein [Paracoccaceae bacterium]